MQKMKLLAKGLEDLSLFLDDLSRDYDSWAADKLIQFEKQAHETHKLARVLRNLAEDLEM